VARETRSTSQGARPEKAAFQAARSGDARGLTRAEAHALRRSAPLTPEQFRSLRELAERGLSPLRHI
jgi:predicted nuclease with RNAse H fold